MPGLKIPERPLGRDAIKLLAMAAMACNHAMHVFRPEDAVLRVTLQIIGWFTAPVMCWFLAEGWEMTSSRRRYFMRMVAMALASQPFFMWVTGSSGLNMFFTLAACMGLFYVLEHIKDPVLAAAAALCVVIATCVMDWPFIAAMMSAIFYYGRKKDVPVWSQFLAAYAGYVGMSSLLGAEYFGLGPVGPFLAGLPVLGAGWAIGLLYNHKRSVGPRALWKWFFYLFYPGHLAVLWILSFAA